MAAPPILLINDPRQGGGAADDAGAAARQGRQAARPHHVRFPIPQSEIDENPNLTQNPGY